MNVEANLSVTKGSASWLVEADGKRITVKTSDFSSTPRAVKPNLSQVVRIYKWLKDESLEVELIEKNRTVLILGKGIPWFSLSWLIKNFKNLMR